MPVTNQKKPQNWNVQFCLVFKERLYLAERNSCVKLFSNLINEIQNVLAKIGNYLIIDQIALNKLIYVDNHPCNILDRDKVVNLAHRKNMSDFSNVYIIHQYDSNKELEEKLFEKYIST